MDDSKYSINIYKLEKKCVSMQLKKIPLLINSFSKSVPDYYEIHKMCNKAVDTHPSTMKFVLECCMT